MRDPVLTWAYVPDPQARWPHRFVASRNMTSVMVEKHSRPVKAWCIEQFGYGNGRWTDAVGLIWISRAEDAFAFRMMWC